MQRLAYLLVLVAVASSDPLQQPDNKNLYKEEVLKEKVSLLARPPSTAPVEIEIPCTIPLTFRVGQNVKLEGVYQMVSAVNEPECATACFNDYACLQAGFMKNNDQGGSCLLSNDPAPCDLQLPPWTSQAEFSGPSVLSCIQCKGVSKAMIPGPPRGVPQPPAIPPPVPLPRIILPPATEPGASENTQEQRSSWFHPHSTADMALP